MVCGVQDPEALCCSNPQAKSIYTVATANSNSGHLLQMNETT